MVGPSLVIDTHEAETFFPEVWLISKPSILLIVSICKKPARDSKQFWTHKKLLFLDNASSACEEQISIKFLFCLSILWIIILGDSKLAKKSFVSFEISPWKSKLIVFLSLLSITKLSRKK